MTIRLKFRDKPMPMRVSSREEKEVQPSSEPRHSTTDKDFNHQKVLRSLNEYHNRFYRRLS